MTTATKTTHRNGPAAADKPAEAGPTGEIAALEALANKYALTTLGCQGRFERALALAEGIRALNDAVRPVMQRILPLQNSALGFLTDKKDSGYPEPVVRECLIEATLRGVYPVGNEFNIISAHCYITKSGYARLVRELPGLTGLKLFPGVPRISTGGAVVPFKASWLLNGRADSLERDIPVRLNSGMGADGAIGKATRKMLASVYGQITGSEQSDGEVGDPELGSASRSDEVLGMLADRKANGGGHATPEQVSRLAELSRGYSVEEFTHLLREAGSDKPSLLTPEQADQLLLRLEASARDAAEAEAGERQAIEAEGR